jgi:alanine racemase
MEEYTTRPRIGTSMREEMRRAWVEVDLGALRQNAVTMRERAGVPLLPMVKADAYGLGSVQVVRALLPLDPWGFGIATVREAAMLRRNGIAARLMIFTPILCEEFPEARALRLVPTFGDASSIARWTESGGGEWHLAIDTGMSRAGVPWHRVGDLVEVCRRHPPEGACTHFHSANRDDGSRQKQQQRFDAAVRALPARPRYLHAENSAAIERQPGSPWDLARPGVFLYGVEGGQDLAVRPEPVAALRARVVELRTVPDAESVSYLATYRADGPRVIATVAAGYADGLPWSLGNRGTALVRERRVPIAGIVTMDMTMLDVTGAECTVGDVATFLGRDGAELLDVNELARVATRSPYELLVGLGLRADRVYVG